MSLPHFVYPRMFSLVTRRVVGQAHLLRPDSAGANLYRYVLGLAAQQARDRVKYAAAVQMSSHTHESLFDEIAERSEFLAHKNSLLARSFNVLRGRKGTFWGAPSRRNKEHLRDSAAVLAGIVYVFCNPVAANLVDWPDEWPGVVGDWRRVLSVPITAERPPFFFDQGDPERGGAPLRVSFNLTKPECFKELEDEAYEALVREAVQAECERIHSERAGPALGVERALALPVTHCPAQLDTELSKPSPRFRGDPELVQRLLQEWIASLAKYMEMRRRWMAGEREGVVFPPGTDKLRRLEEAPTAVLDPDSPFAFDSG